MWYPLPTWLFHHRQNRVATVVLGILEVHDAVVLVLVRAVDRVGVAEDCGPDRQESFIHSSFSQRTWTGAESLAVLTQFLHRFDGVLADPVAAAVVDVLAPLEVLALHALPESRETHTQSDAVAGDRGPLQRNSCRF